MPHSIYAWLFHALTEKEQLQVELYGIHAKLVLESFIQVDTIQGDVHQRWPGTERMILEMIRNKEMGKEVIYG